MSDHFRKHTGSFQNKLAAALLGLIVFAATTNASAAEGEQFALINQSTVLFDGGSGSLTGEFNGIPYEIIQGYAVAQGDMVLGRVLANGQVEVTAQARGIGQASAFERWSDGIIPYQFDDTVTQIQRDRAQQAIAHWNARTKIKMVRRTTENATDYSDYINFELSGGCASYVGKKGGEQTVWLADNCTVGSIIHEIGHAIGLFHEHTRPDRDNFVSIHLDNVTSGKELNFDVIDAGANNYSDYDYGSIMHYGEYFFSKNGERSISVPDGVVVGQRDALSDKDISSIDLMYATNLKLDLSHKPNETNTQLDLVITNTGDLGAAELLLTASWGDAADWLSISTNSGWDCQKFDRELRCTRATLRGVSDSSFSILVDGKSASIDSLKVRLESRTLDTDLSNNVFNDTIEPKTTAPTPDPTQEPVPTTDTPEDTTEPEDTATTPGESVPATDMTDSGEQPVPAAANAGDESSGGGAAVYLLLLAFGAGLKRRT